MLSQSLVWKRLYSNQNGDWEYANFADDNENGYTVKQSDLSMMPIYFV